MLTFYSLCLHSAPKSFAKAFSSGYLIGEVLHKFELQDDFSKFSQSRLVRLFLTSKRGQFLWHLVGLASNSHFQESSISGSP